METHKNEGALRAEPEPDVTGGEAGGSHRDQHAASSPKAALADLAEFADHRDLDLDPVITLGPNATATDESAEESAAAEAGLELELEKGRRGSGGPRAQKRVANNTRRLRMERMMSKAELARRAGVSTLTIDRVERGMNCRMDTKRKIIEALGLKPSDRSMVFAEDE